MSLVEIHEAVAAAFGDNLALSFDEHEWKRVSVDAAKNALVSATIRDIQTQFTGLLADAELDASGLAISHFPPGQLTQMRATGLAARVTLKTLAGPGKVSSYVITFAEIKFETTVVDGIVMLSPMQDSVYTSTPPDTSDPDRQTHLDFLLQNGWTQNALDSFVQTTEPFLGYNIASLFFSDAFSSVAMFDLANFFPAIKMSGGFRVVGIGAGTHSIVCFVPDFYEKAEPTQCSMEAVENSIYSTVHPSLPDSGDGNLTVQTLAPNIFRQYQANPVQPNAGSIYVYIPRSATELLFDPIEVVKKGRDKLLSTGSSHRIGPFVISHSLRLELLRQLAFSWALEGPVVNIETTVMSSMSLDVYLKIGKIKTKVVGGSADAQYGINYNGSLYSDPLSGSLGFLGEFYDPTNLDYHIDLDTPLPGFMDNVVEWFLNVIAKPVVRGLVTYLLVAATWPFMSRFATPALGGFDAILKIAGYFRDQVDDRSMSVAVELSNNG